jgi:hypothetical protein
MKQSTHIHGSDTRRYHKRFHIAPQALGHLPSPCEREIFHEAAQRGLAVWLIFVTAIVLAFSCPQGCSYIEARLTAVD